MDYFYFDVSLMRVAMRFVLPIAVFLHICSAPVGNAQEIPTGSKDFRVVFEDIQHGFEISKVSVFSPYLGLKVQVTLKGEESGYFSSNHAYYILENFLKSRKVISFEFSAVGETEAMPYATGTAVFSHKGTREIAQVYVALMKSADKWVISEINIY